jgi:hypothetical protein
VLTSGVHGGGVGIVCWAAFGAVFAVVRGCGQVQPPATAGLMGVVLALHPDLGALSLATVFGLFSTVAGRLANLPA